MCHTNRANGSQFDKPQQSYGYGIWMHNQGAITFLPTLELELTRAFYGGVLGLEQVVDQGSCLIFRAFGDAYWGFCARAEPLSNPERVVLTVVTEDVASWHERLTQKGIRVDAPPRENLEYGIEHFYAEEPNGYRLEIQRFLREDWGPGR